ncbi:MAG TPA: potassium transporter TrkG, partial [Micavibrio sp.]
YNSGAIEGVAIVFMLVSSLPFILYVRVLNGDIKALFRNTQVRAFLGMLLVFIFMMTFWIASNGLMPLPQALGQVTFHIISVVTSTGFVTVDYTQWGTLPVVMFFFLACVGGCTGSTTGGIKIMRFQIMSQILVRHLKKLPQPSAIIPLRYEGRTIGDDIAYSVMVFIFTFMISSAALACALGMCGLDLVTSISGALSALGNVGIGSGPVIGPAGNFAALPDAAKWILSLGMLLGRLEMFTVLVLLTPSFWSR